MKRKFIFLDGSSELVLPVTPRSVELANGIAIETIRIHGIGDIRTAGFPTLAEITIDSFFPAVRYDFAERAALTDPYLYVAFFKKRIKGRKPLRFIISDTDINIPVLIGELRYGERDGGNDVYYTISLSEYAYTAPITPVSEDAEQRPADTAPAPPKTYTVVYGDTLWSIARRFLGKGSYYKLIAEANNIPDPNVLYVGQVLVIPEVP